MIYPTTDELSLLPESQLLDYWTNESEQNDAIEHQPERLTSESFEQERMNGEVEVH